MIIFRFSVDTLNSISLFLAEKHESMKFEKWKKNDFIELMCW